MHQMMERLERGIWSMNFKMNTLLIGDIFRLILQVFRITSISMQQAFLSINRQRGGILAIIALLLSRVMI
jgi:hypothetical protein